MFQNEKSLRVIQSRVLWTKLAQWTSTQTMTTKNSEEKTHKFCNNLIKLAKLNVIQIVQLND